MNLWIVTCLLLIVSSTSASRRRWSSGSYPTRSSCQAKCHTSGMTCQDSHTHGHSSWKCAPSDCGTLSAPEHGTVTYSHGTTFESVARYSCHPDYELSYPASRTCLSSGRWSEDAPICDPIADCGDLHDPEHGMVHTPDGTKLHSIATYTCDNGYILTPASSRVCLSDCKWSGVQPTCEPIDCGPLEDPCDGHVVTATGTTLNKQATYSCELGFVLDISSVRTCQADGTWSGVKPCCELDECDKPANPSHGSVETPDGTEIGDEAIYTCDVCYAMDGNDVRTCLPTGYWSGQAPTCSLAVTGYTTSFGDSCYRFYPTDTSFADGQAICAANGGKLVEIETPEEQNFLAGILATGSYAATNEWWMGLSDSFDEGTHVWISTLAEAIYTNWDTSIGEPNDIPNTPADCVAMIAQQSYLWRTRNCGELYGFICELEFD